MMYLISFNQEVENDTLFIDQIYQDESQMIITTRILEFDSISKNDLMRRFEIWGSQNFVDYNQARISKTESQITIRYISPLVPEMYVIMIVEFKNNEIEIVIIDGENVPTKSFGLKSFFKNGMIVYNSDIDSYAKNKSIICSKYILGVELAIRDIKKYIKI